MSEKSDTGNERINSCINIIGINISVLVYV